MNRGLLWRGLLIAVIVAVGALSAFPLSDEIKLGLDLRGGTHLVLQVEVEDALGADSQKDLDSLLDLARDEGLTGVSGERTGVDSFVVHGIPSQREELVDGHVQDSMSGWQWNREGDNLRFQMSEQHRSRLEDLAVTQALQTIRNRVDAFGVAEPVIQRQGLGGDRIVVQLPGVDDPARVKRLIKNTAFLEFRLVAWPGPGQPAPDRETILEQYDGQLPGELEIMPTQILDAEGEVVGRGYYALEKRQVITGRDLDNARPSTGQFGEPVVSFTLTHAAGQRFAEITGSNVGRGLAIVLDRRVVSAPRINSRISDSGIIEGGFTQQEVQDLATVLRTGALPAGITYLEERSVGPSLGQDSIRQGLLAGVIGSILVVVTLLLVYQLSGINAIVALGLNIVLLFGALAYFGATLTLPGIAGIVLTIGMAVDANVLIFQRIREELRHGRTVRSAIEAGFAKAFSSVIDANVTTLIAALFLFQFGTGPVRGFAVTLSIGILASLFTAIFVSRWIFDLVLSRRRRVEKLWI